MSGGRGKMPQPPWLLSKSGPHPAFAALRGPSRSIDDRRIGRRYGVGKVEDLAVQVQRTVEMFVHHAGAGEPEEREKFTLPRCGLGSVPAGPVDVQDVKR